MGDYADIVRRAMLQGADDADREAREAKIKSAKAAVVCPYTGDVTLWFPSRWGFSTVDSKYVSQPYTRDVAEGWDGVGCKEMHSLLCVERGARILRNRGRGCFGEEVAVYSVHRGGPFNCAATACAKGVHQEWKGDLGCYAIYGPAVIVWPLQ